jgi:hypothetical protein
MSALTPEARARATEARRTAIKVGAAKFRRDWVDSGKWDELAKNRGITLPRWYTAPTARALKRWHRRLDNGPFEAVYGCKPSRLMELNPTMPLRAFIGLMLERGCK